MFKHFETVQSLHFWRWPELRWRWNLTSSKTRERTRQRSCNFATMLSSVTATSKRSRTECCGTSVQHPTQFLPDAKSLFRRSSRSQKRYNFCTYNPCETEHVRNQISYFSDRVRALPRPRLHLAIRRLQCVCQLAYHHGEDIWCSQTACCPSPDQSTHNLHPGVFRIQEKQQRFPGRPQMVPQPVGGDEEVAGLQEEGERRLGRIGPGRRWRRPLLDGRHRSRTDRAARVGWPRGPVDSCRRAPM